jgi:hypothetical protein
MITGSRLVIAVIALAVLAGGAYWWRRPAPSPPVVAPVIRPARTVTLGGAEGAPVRSFPGRVQAARGQRVEVSFRVLGTLLELPVRTNQVVTRGQLLARLDPRDFETTLAQASSAVAEARARLAAMQAGDRPEDIRILESQLSAEQGVPESVMALVGGKEVKSLSAVFDFLPDHGARNDPAPSRRVLLGHGGDHHGWIGFRHCADPARRAGALRCDVPHPVAADGDAVGTASPRASR